MKPLVALSLIALTGCWGDETLTGYGAANRIWKLESVDGVKFPARAELMFPEEGKITGQAPCNRFFADQGAPYPWFKSGPVGTTKMACPDLPQEALFINALEAMTLAEVAGDTLILSTDAGREMVFRAAE